MREELTYRRSVWISSLIALVGLGLFIGVAALIPLPRSSTGLLLLSVFLALAPAAIWLGFFSQQDRAEPEPVRLVVRVFVFGALAAAAVAVPVASRFADETVSLFPNVALRLILTILSVSLMQEVLKVAMVRYVVLGTEEFDSYPDGIVYGLASGLGFATILTVAFVLDSGGVLPLAGAIRAVDHALVHGALGAVSGYYLGRVKIDGKKVGWLLRGLTIVTVVNGVYQVASDEVSRRLVFNPWYGLAVSAVLAVVVGVVLFAFFRRAMRRAVGDLKTVSLQVHARSKDMPWDIKVRYDWLLIGAFVLSLIAGFVPGVMARSRTVLYTGPELAVQFRYPAGWGVQSGETGGLALRDLSAQGTWKPTIRVIDDKLREGATLDFVVAEYVTSKERVNLVFAEIERTEGLTVDGQPAIRSDYRYVTETAAGPTVVRGIETYVQVGQRLYIFTYEAEPDAFEDALRAYERLLDSVQFEAGQ